MNKTKNYLSLLLFLLLTFAPVQAFAGDFANLNFIGFSKDGKYLAFEEYGTSDGAGFPYANIYFVDVAKNQFAGKPFKLFIEKETSTEAAARKQIKTAAAKKMLELKIIAGNTGTHTVSHLLNELPLEDKKDESLFEKVRFTQEIYSMWEHGDDYTLTVNRTKVKPKDCVDYEQPIYKIEVALNNNKSNKSQTLQKDAELPAARGCTFDYQIQDVFTYEDKIAVFLNVFQPGFEGNDMRFMVVTGNIENGEK
jgi:predicted secreted protein